jgi:hypothetical protein
MIQRPFGFGAAVVTCRRSSDSHQHAIRQPGEKASSDKAAGTAQRTPERPGSRITSLEECPVFFPANEFFSEETPLSEQRNRTLPGMRPLSLNASGLP